MPYAPNATRKLVVTAALAGLAWTGAAGAQPEFEPRGRMHMDGGFHQEDDVALNNDFLFRRARLGVDGSLDDDWNFKLEYDFAENGVSAKGVYLGRSLGAGEVRIGHFKAPVGLNELTSSNDITFIERASSSNIIAVGRRIGAGYSLFGEHLGGQVMAYGRSMGASTQGDMQTGLAGRLVFNPLKTADQVIHLGLSAAREDRGDQNSVSLSDRPEARPAGQRLINTGSLPDVQTTTRGGLEAAWRAGPFSLEGEVLRTELDRANNDNPTFGGYHVQGSWVLTGESRAYGGGSFGSVSPAGPAGAWELAARYSHADLNDAGVTGGEQNNTTLGLNWYATDQVRFMANYIAVDVTDSGAQGLDEQGNTITVGDDAPRIFLLRAQYSF